MSTVSPTRDSDDLWQFSGTLYGTGDVKDWCLKWQETYKADVTLLLWLCWLEHCRGVHLDKDQISGAMKAVSDWRQNIIEPVRHARTHLKTIRESLPPHEYEHMRGKLLETELAAERVEQGLLLRFFGDISENQTEQDGSNITRYLGLLTDGLSADDLVRAREIDSLAKLVSENCRVS